MTKSKAVVGFRIVRGLAKEITIGMHRACDDILAAREEMIKEIEAEQKPEPITEKPKKKITIEYY